MLMNSTNAPVISSRPSLESRNWLELPTEIMAMILQKLGAIEILRSADQVCSSWHKICKDPLMWSVIDTHSFGKLVYSDRTLDIFCWRAVFRSSGLLVDINIEFFGSDEFLEFVALSSKQLRRIRIASCLGISNEELMDSISKLPLLEHLDISDRFVDGETLEMIGKGCPLLKLLKLNKACWDGPRKEIDDEAFAIAKTMPKLQHLEIIANELTNKGLQAILDGCPDLESLDVRECLNLDLDGELGQECARRIKKVLKGSEKYTSADHYDSCFSAYMEALSLLPIDSDTEYNFEEGDYDDFDPFFLGW